MPICSVCGARLSEGAVFCDECGRAVVESAHAAAVPASPGMGGKTVVAANRCPSCGVQVSPMDVFCENCGAPLRERQQVPPPLPSASGTGLSGDGKSVSPDRESQGTKLVGRTGGGTSPGPKRLCNRCGAELTPGTRFCETCGAEVPPLPEPIVPELATAPQVAAHPIDEAGAQMRVEEAADWPAPEPPAQMPVESRFDAMAPRAGANPPVEPAGQPEDAAAPLVPEAPVVPPVPPSAESRVIARVVPAAGEVGLALPVGRTEATFGRDDPVRGIYPDLDLTTYGGAAGGVSRVHARITQAGPQGAGEPAFYLEDLDSVNGTFVNGEKLAPGVLHPIDHGDTLTFGRVKLVFQIERAESDS